MMRTDFSIQMDIPAPRTLVWSLVADVERWPEWTASVSRVNRLSSGPFQVGSHVRIHQPKLPPAIWRVTELTPGASFTWVSRALGVRVTARHTVAAAGNGSSAALSIHYEGVLGGLLARWVGELNQRYLNMEASGLAARCKKLAARQ
jgi:Polyketide cyclase / dehydrase and lipid transport